MIRPEGFRGAVFGTAAEGDLRTEVRARQALSRDLGTPVDWAFVNQVHGARVVEATTPGNQGDADAVIVRVPGLSAGIGTADCVPVIIEADDAVAVVHAGWRGAAAGVIERALESLQSSGTAPRRAAIGPAIGACCYEVGDDVLELFPDHRSHTRWGSHSVDLPGFVADGLAGLDVWRSNRCTYTAPDLWSYRRDRTKRRQVTVGWLPNGSR